MPLAQIVFLSPQPAPLFPEGDIEGEVHGMPPPPASSEGLLTLEDVLLSNTSPRIPHPTGAGGGYQTPEWEAVGPGAGSNLPGGGSGKLWEEGEGVAEAEEAGAAKEEAVGGPKETEGGGKEEFETPRTETTEDGGGGENGEPATGKLASGSGQLPRKGGEGTGQLREENQLRDGDEALSLNEALEGRRGERYEEAQSAEAGEGELLPQEEDVAKHLPEEVGERKGTREPRPAGLEGYEGDGREEESKRKGVAKEEQGPQEAETEDLPKDVQSGDGVEALRSTATEGGGLEEQEVEKGVAQGERETERLSEEGGSGKGTQLPIPAAAQRGGWSGKGRWQPSLGTALVGQKRSRQPEGDAVQEAAPLGVRKSRRLQFKVAFKGSQGEGKQRWSSVASVSSPASPLPPKSPPPSGFGPAPLPSPCENLPCFYSFAREYPLLPALLPLHLPLIRV